jgi:hypothetical protein
VESVVISGNALIVPPPSCRGRPRAFLAPRRGRRISGPVNESRMRACWKLGLLLEIVERGKAPGKGKMISVSTKSFLLRLKSSISRKTEQSRLLWPNRDHSEAVGLIEVQDVNASADASHWAAGWVIAREHRAQHASRIPREMLKV